MSIAAGLWHVCRPTVTYRYGARQGIVAKRIEIAAVPDILSHWRVVYGGRVVPFDRLVWKNWRFLLRTVHRSSAPPVRNAGVLIDMRSVAAILMVGALIDAKHVIMHAV
jgi:hypothetical protein